MGWPAAAASPALWKTHRRSDRSGSLTQTHSSQTTATTRAKLRRFIGKPCSQFSQSRNPQINEQRSAKLCFRPHLFSPHHGPQKTFTTLKVSKNAKFDDWYVVCALGHSVRLHRSQPMQSEELRHSVNHRGCGIRAASYAVGPASWLPEACVWLETEARAA